MASPVETAGLVLATLPLFVEIAKAYARGVDTIFNIALHSRRDQSLGDFYDEFFWNVSELHQHISKISHVATAGQSIPASLSDLGTWSERSDIARCLKRYFDNEAAYDQYVVITSKIATLLAMLVENQSLYINKTDLDRSGMFQTLRNFARDRDSESTKSKLMERFKFFKTQKERNHCLALLEKWNKRLYGLIIRNQSQGLSQSWPVVSSTRDSIVRPWDSLVLSIKDPSAHVRVLTKDLYTVLSNSWHCQCQDNHEARFCLNLHNLQGAEKSFPDVEAEFYFLVKTAELGGWHEATVGMRTARSPLGGDELAHVCDAMRACMTAFRLRLLMEDISGQHHLWQLSPKPRNVSVLESEPPVSLRNLLSGNAKMAPIEKRELAPICAYSLLLLHDTPWLSNGYGKTNLSFFYKAEHEPDFARPFISTRFELPTARAGTTRDIFHRSPEIFALGMLLIEIFNEKPIEKWRRRDEEAMVSQTNEAMFNLLVANRIVEKMDPSPSTRAIKACLDLFWIPQGREVQLSDPDVRNGLFNEVIQPLEAEIAMVSSSP